MVERISGAAAKKATTKSDKEKTNGRATHADTSKGGNIPKGRQETVEAVEDDGVRSERGEGNKEREEEDTEQGREKEKLPSRVLLPTGRPKHTVSGGSKSRSAGPRGLSVPASQRSEGEWEAFADQSGFVAGTNAPQCAPITMTPIPRYQTLLNCLYAEDQRGVVATSAESALAADVVPGDTVAEIMAEVLPGWLHTGLRFKDIGVMLGMITKCLKEVEHGVAMALSPLIHFEGEEMGSSPSYGSVVTALPGILKKGLESTKEVEQLKSPSAQSEAVQAFANVCKGLTHKKERLDSRLVAKENELLHFRSLTDSNGDKAYRMGQDLAACKEENAKLVEEHAEEVRVLKRKHKEEMAMLKRSERVLKAVKGCRKKARKEMEEQREREKEAEKAEWVKSITEALASKIGGGVVMAGAGDSSQPGPGLFNTGGRPTTVGLTSGMSCGAQSGEERSLSAMSASPAKTFQEKPWASWIQEKDAQKGSEEKSGSRDGPLVEGFEDTSTKVLSDQVAHNNGGSKEICTDGSKESVGGGSKESGLTVGRDGSNEALSRLRANTKMIAKPAGATGAVTAAPRARSILFPWTQKKMIENDTETRSRQEQAGKDCIEEVVGESPVAEVILARKAAVDKPLSITATQARPSLLGHGSILVSAMQRAAPIPVQGGHSATIEAVENLPAASDTVQTNIGYNAAGLLNNSGSLPGKPPRLTVPISDGTCSGYCVCICPEQGCNGTQNAT